MERRGFNLTIQEAEIVNVFRRFSPSDQDAILAVLQRQAPTPIRVLPLRTATPSPRQFPRVSAFPELRQAGS